MENLESLVLQTFELESNMVLCNYYNIDAIILSGNGETPRVWKFGFGGSPNIKMLCKLMDEKAN